MTSFFIKSMGHYIEQPKVINTAWKASKYAALAGGTALFSYDVFKARPEEKKKTAIRTGLVLGATAIGTTLAAKFLMKKPGVIKSALKELSGKYSDDIVSLIKKEGKSPAELEKLFKILPKKEQIKLFGKGPLHELKHHVLEPYQKASREFPHLAEKLGKHKSRQEIAELIEEMGENNFNKYFIDENHSHGFRDMVNFFTVGAASIVSGFAGGWLAQKINKAPGEKTVAMVKEGIFQFIANIAMCAVGASIGLGISKAVFKPTQKLARFATVGTGLMAGISFGGAIANYVGERWVNPYFDKLQGKEPSPHNKRSIEFWDAILHLDDLPTALALAGVEAMVPFIPLFFAFSGYRTGIGYENHHKHGKLRKAVGNHIPGTKMRHNHKQEVHGKYSHQPTHTSGMNQAQVYTNAQYAPSLQHLIRQDSPFSLLHEQITTKAVQMQ